MRALVAALLVSVVLGGCGSDAPSASTEPLVIGGAWRATLVGGLGPVAGSVPTLTIAGDRIEGNTGCNRFGGRITVSGSSIRIDDLVQTLMGCDGAVGQVEVRFTAILRAAASAAIQDGRLVLSGPEGQVVFERVSGPG